MPDKRLPEHIAIDGRRDREKARLGKNWRGIWAICTWTRGRFIGRWHG